MLTYNPFSPLDEAQGIETVRTALKKGINYVDTAPYYGQGKSEEILGKALKGVPRKAYYIATKIGRYTTDFDTMFDYSAKKTRESVEKSLKLLGVDYIDVIQIHDIEFVPTLDTILNEALPTLEQLRKEGKVRNIGVSAYPMGILKECIQKAGPGRFNVSFWVYINKYILQKLPFQTVLCYGRYSLLDESLRDYIQFFKDQGLAVICASVHGIGLLSRGMKGILPTHPAPQEIKDVARRAADICEEDDVELGKLAMFYAAQYEEPSIFLVGMQKLPLLEMNLKAVTEGLTPKEAEVLEKLKKTVFTKQMNWENIEITAYRKHFGFKVWRYSGF